MFYHKLISLSFIKTQMHLVGEAPPIQDPRLRCDVSVCSRHMLQAREANATMFYLFGVTSFITLLLFFLNEALGKFHLPEKSFDKSRIVPF